MGSYKGAEIANKLIELCKNNHYFKILKNKSRGTHCIQYGPLGALMKNNIEKQWWNNVLLLSDGNVYTVSNPVKSIPSDCMNQYRDVLKLCEFRLPFGIAESQNTLSEFADDAVEMDGTINFDSLIKRCMSQSTRLTVRYFSSPKSFLHTFDKWERQRRTWWRSFLGDPSRISVTTPDSDNMQTSYKLDINFGFPWGAEVVEEIHNDGIEPVKAVSQNTDLEAKAKDGRKIIVPQALRCTLCLEVAVLVYLIDALQFKERQGVIRNILRLDPRLAPYKTALCVYTNSSNVTKLRDLSTYIITALVKAKIMVYPNPGLYSQASLTAQYTRFDEMGIPYVITVNDNSLQNGIITVRYRDTGLKEEVHATEVKDKLLCYLKDF